MNYRQDGNNRRREFSEIVDMSPMKRGEQGRDSNKKIIEHNNFIMIL